MKKRQSQHGPLGVGGQMGLQFGACGFELCAYMVVCQLFRERWVYTYTHMSMCHLIGDLKYEKGLNLEKGTP